MRLVEVKLKNFRAYRGECTVPLQPLTAFVGRNDVGKSSVFEALGIFFGNELCKADAADPCVFVEDKVFEITCAFEGLPSQLVLDDRSQTDLATELLLNAAGQLEVKKTYDCSTGKVREDVYLVANHPTNSDLRDLLLKKNTELKALAAKRGGAADKRSNVDLRRTIRETEPDIRLAQMDVPVAKEGAKQIWSTIEKHLPLFALFRSDRPSTDEDSEVQDPMRFAVRQAIASVEPQLAEIRQRVEQEVLAVAQRTLEKLGELDPALASTLKPQFRADPKWEAFKLSLTGDRDIPINVTHQPRRDDFRSGGIQAGSQQGGCGCQSDERSRTSGKRFGACARPSARA